LHKLNHPELELTGWQRHIKMIWLCQRVW